MKLKLNSHTIKAISVVLPKNSRSLNEELKQCNLSESKYKILQQNISIKKSFRMS